MKSGKDSDLVRKAFYERKNARDNNLAYTSRSSSPLGRADFNNQIWINGQLPTADNYHIYKDYNRDLANNPPTVHKEILRYNINNHLKPLKGINILSSNPEGEYNNVDGWYSPTSNLININRGKADTLHPIKMLNHEIRHSHTYNTDKWAKNFLEPIAELLSPKEKIEMQDVVDPRGYFSKYYPVNSLNIDELNAHILQNIEEELHPSGNDRVNNIIKHSLNLNKKMYNKSQDDSKYSNILPTINRRIAEMNVKQPQLEVHSMFNQRDNPNSTLKPPLYNKPQKKAQIKTQIERELLSPPESYLRSPSVSYNSANNTIGPDTPNSAVDRLRHNIAKFKKNQLFPNKMKDQVLIYNQNQQSSRPQSRDPIIKQRDANDQWGDREEERKSHATGGSISSGLGSISDYLNQRYAGGGGVGLGNMGRFFGLYPKIN